MATLLSLNKRTPEPSGPALRSKCQHQPPGPLFWLLDFTLMFAGLLTSVSVSVLGVVLAVAGCVGWFREVFPREHEESVPVDPGGSFGHDRAPRNRATSRNWGAGARLASC